MNSSIDYLIVGSGLTGSVIARLLADAGRQVYVVERRYHLGGNVYDYAHHSGIRVHAYGPHYFRTSSKEIWEFVNRFSRFFKYEAVVKAYVDGKYENWPVTANYIKKITKGKWKPGFKCSPGNFKEAALEKMPSIIYEKFVKGYTEKQWGVAAHKLSMDLVGRFDVRKNSDPRLKQCLYQGIPEDGYAKFINNMLAGIPVALNFNYLKNKDKIRQKKMLIFTGPIDEFFSFTFGWLSYRSQKRKHTYLSDINQYQPCGQVNYPSANTHSHIRTIEWKHMMPSNQIKSVQGTVITKETPFSPSNPNQYEYPFPDNRNQKLYQRYKNMAESLPNLLICGRLGEYQYYDMDQAIIRAMVLVKRILRNG